MKNIEVEVRALISEEEFLRLKKFFDKKAKPLNHYKDETLYFDRNGRARLKIDKDRAYFVYKSFKAGQIHTRYREEMEIELKKSDFLSAQKFLGLLGKPVVIKWIRERFIWRFKGVKVCLDNTKSYGRIIELETMAASKDKKKAHDKLLKILDELHIKLTPEKELQKHYEHYLKNWRKLV